MIPTDILVLGILNTDGFGPRTPSSEPIGNPNDARGRFRGDQTTAVPFPFFEYKTKLCIDGSEWVVENLLGGGGHGQAYELVSSEGCRRVLKVVTKLQGNAEFAKLLDQLPVEIFQHDTDVRGSEYICRIIAACPASTLACSLRDEFACPTPPLDQDEVGLVLMDLSCNGALSDYFSPPPRACPPAAFPELVVRRLARQVDHSTSF